MAELTQHFDDADLDQPWAWRKHDEGVRFAFLGAYHELRDLAVTLAHQRAKSGPPVTAAQRALSQYHAAYRDLQAIFIGVTDEDYSREPAPGEWPLRYVLGHTAGTQRHFFTLVHYGLERQRDGQGKPSRLPDGETDRVVGPYADFRLIMDNQGLAEMQAFYDALHQRTLREFTPMSDEELAGPSLWWEGEEYTLQYRLHRFDAHLRQHTIQAEKSLALIGRPPNEARRLLRLIYNALAEVEAATFGAETLGQEQRSELAAVIIGRAEEVVNVVAQAHEMVTAVQTGDLARVKALLAAEPRLVNALDANGLPTVLVATYYGQKEAALALVEGGAELTIFAAAAVGRLDRVQEAVQEWPGWVNEHSRDGFTPLQLACFFGHEETALWLMDQGADINAVAKNKQQIRPVHAAAANGNLTLLRALLERGADVNARQEGDFTPLHEAANNGHMAMAQLFLQHGADVNAKSAQGQTPLALALAKGHHDMAELLRQETS
jgi:ankyrin repeat protein